MEIFSGRKNQLSLMVERYLVKLEECIKNFNSAIEVYFAKGLSRELDELIEKTHISESMADDIKREIGLNLYEKYLIPESRGDILDLLKTTDSVMEKAQSVLYQIQTEFLEMPDFLRDDFIKLVDTNVQSFQDVIRAIRSLFQDIKQVKDVTSEIDKIESSSDRLEREIIKKLFSTPEVEMGRKILLKELVIETGNISDLSEAVADKLNIIAVKRSL
jgi:predicted phosphate transport protein (TIGR00153 family)